MTSSIYAVDTTTVGTPLAADTDILSSDLEVGIDSVKPGGSSLMRVSFSFVFASSPARISVYESNTFKGTLNADNLFNIASNGYYRFDIDIRAADSLNLRCNEEITSIHFFRVDLVQFGA